MQVSAWVLKWEVYIVVHARWIHQQVITVNAQQLLVCLLGLKVLQVGQLTQALIVHLLDVEALSAENFLTDPVFLLLLGQDVEEVLKTHILDPLQRHMHSVGQVGVQTQDPGRYDEEGNHKDCAWGPLVPELLYVVPCCCIQMLWVQWSDLIPEYLLVGENPCCHDAVHEWASI